MTKRTAAQQKRREWMVKVGVYLAILVGVVGQALVKKVDFKTLTVVLDVSVIGFMQMGVALVGAALVYARMRGQISDEDIAKKADYVWSILWVALAQGIAVVAVIGKIGLGGG